MFRLNKREIDFFFFFIFFYILLFFIQLNNKIHFKKKIIRDDNA